MHFDLISLIQTVGFWGIIGILFAESGLFFGFFLPGDSLIFTAGFLASQGYFGLLEFLFFGTLASILGNTVGYFFGKYYGKKLFTREDNIFFHKKHIVEAQEFYKKHGVKTIILARFVPIVRTFAPIVAGIADMDYKIFTIFNVVGGVLWVVGLGLLGYFLGQLIPAEAIDKYLLAIVGAIVLISIAPGIVHFVKKKK